MWRCQHSTKPINGYHKSFPQKPMLNFIRSHDLHDFLRFHHTMEKDFTFFSAPHNSYSRIDYFIVDKWLWQNIFCSTIDLITWSDHAHISITIISKASNPTRLWKANTHILQMSPYDKQLHRPLYDFFLHNLGSVPHPSTLWMAYKAFIRGILIQLSSIARKEDTAS